MCLLASRHLLDKAGAPADVSMCVMREEVVMCVNQGVILEQMGQFDNGLPSAITCIEIGWLYYN